MCNERTTFHNLLPFYTLYYSFLPHSMESNSNENKVILALQALKNDPSLTLRRAGRGLRCVVAIVISVKIYRHKSVCETYG
jgi:hypothetical protein